MLRIVISLTIFPPDFPAENAMISILQTTGLWIWLRRHPRDPVNSISTQTFQRTSLRKRGPFAEYCGLSHGYGG
jgi:hypothetical protein